MIIVFLFHVRSALVPILVLPIAVVASFIPMYFLGVTSNIMSLGGIALAIGVLVDASIVMVENAYRHVSEGDVPYEQQPQVILTAAKQVGRPIFFSLAIIIVSFAPVFLLEAQEGRMFGSPKVHVGPELAEGAPGGPVTGAFPGFSLGVLVMGQGPVEARGKRAVFSKARWARLCVRGAGSFHRACPFVTSGPRGALLHLPRVQLVKSRCPYDLRCTCVILQPERWGPNSQTLAPLRVRAHRGDHAL